MMSSSMGSSIAAAANDLVFMEFLTKLPNVHVQLSESRS